MRKFLIGAATIATLAAIPTVASAQASTATGIAVGAGTGFLIGGPPGAVVGGVIGGSVGIAAEPRVYVDDYYSRNVYEDRVYYSEPRVYAAPRTRVVVRSEPREVCWRDRWNRTFCEYR